MLKNIDIPDQVLSHPLSLHATRLLNEADQRIERFTYMRQGPPIPGFVASDFRMVDACLHWIVDQHLAAGQSFCEWGSGFGVATMLAALHDFDACGIEVEADLVDNARLLADDLGIDAQFAHGSVLPEAAEDWLEYLEDLAHVDTDSPSGYDALGLEITDFDLFYVFPWPGEYRFWEELFHRYASYGALLMSYHGVESMRLQRKVQGERRRDSRRRR
jgi:hypothetical protein